MAKFSVVMLVCADLSRSRDFHRDVRAVRPGSLQLGFVVADVDEFVAGCVARNIPVFQDPYDEPFGRIAIVGDPDGYPLQVATLKKRCTPTGSG